MEQDEIAVLKKFKTVAELIDQMIQIESGSKQSFFLPRDQEPETLIEEIPDNPIPEEWMRLDNFGEIRFNPQAVRAISRRGSRLTLFFDTPLLSAEFPDADLVGVFENMVKLPRRQGI